MSGYAASNCCRRKQIAETERRQFMGKLEGLDKTLLFQFV